MVPLPATAASERSTRRRVAIVANDLVISSNCHPSILHSWLTIAKNPGFS
jgi:hypothetical protein